MQLLTGANWKDRPELSPSGPAQAATADGHSNRRRAAAARALTTLTRIVTQAQRPTRNSESLAFSAPTASELQWQSLRLEASASDKVTPASG